MGTAFCWALLLINFTCLSKKLNLVYTGIMFLLLDLLLNTMDAKDGGNDFPSLSSAKLILHFGTSKLILLYIYYTDYALCLLSS